MRAAIEFEMIDEQVGAFAPLQELARLNAEKGELGIILAQIGKVNPNGKSLIKAAFIDSELAWKIKNLLAENP